MNFIDFARDPLSTNWVSPWLTKIYFWPKRDWLAYPVDRRQCSIAIAALLGEDSEWKVARYAVTSWSGFENGLK